MEDVTNTLGGVDLSGSEPVSPVLPEDDWTPNAGIEGEPVESPVEPDAPVDEPADEFPDTLAPKSPEAEAPPAEPDPEPAKAAKGKEFRPYVVLEHVTYEDDTVAFVPVKDPRAKDTDLVMESRNAQVALRDAFKIMCSADTSRTTAKLVVVPKRMWSPTTVQIQTRHTVSVTG